MSKKAIQISGEIATETTKAIITSGAGLILAAFFPETIPYWVTTLCIPSKVGFSVFCEKIKDKFNVKEGYFASVNEIYNKKVEDVLKKGTIGDECFVPEYEHFRRYYFLCNEHENEISENNCDENGVVNYLSPQTIKEILKLDTKNTNQDTVIKVADEILKNVITEITDNTDLAPTYWAMRNCKDINAFEKILNDINNTIQKEFEETRDTITKSKEEIIDAINRKNVFNNKIITTSSPSGTSTVFIGRENDIEDIKEEAKTKKVVLMNGMGGIGKTEICRHLFWYYCDNAVDGVENIGWINYHDSLESSLLGNFKGVEEKDSTKYIQAVKNRIDKLGNKLLLFVDNANDISDSEAVELSKFACRIIMTSRKNRVTSFHPFEVKKLPSEKCLEIYQKYSNDNSRESVEYIEKILILADYHTQTVELLAKTQKSSDLTAEELHKMLIDNGFSLAGISETVDGRHGDDVTNEIFIEHLAIIFDISKIAPIEEQINVLRLFSLLAPNEPIRKRVLKNWFSLDNLNPVNELIAKGWLKEDANNEISIHPVISEVVRYKFPAEFEFAQELVNKIIDELKDSYEKGSGISVWNKLITHSVAVAKNFNKSEHEDYATLLNNIGSVYDKIGDYNKALEFYEKALNIRENVLGTEHSDTATSYNNIGSVYDSMGDYNKALEFYEKALNVKIKLLGTEHPSTATSYNNIGGVYYSMGDYYKALEFYEKVLNIREKVLGTEHPNTATSYNNIGSTYDSMGDYNKALEFYEKALRICEKVLGTEHPNTATSYNNIGSTYDSMGDYNKALEYYKKALKIVEKALGTKHRYTAATYNNIGLLYDNIGDYPKALENHEKSLNIRKEVLGTEHSDTATSYNNIGLLYYNMGDNPKALEYYEKALKIREKVLGTEHRSTATSYNNIGGVYRVMGDYNKALEFYEKALNIREKVLGTEHPSTATSYNNIGLLYKNMGNYNKALEFYEKALNVKIKLLGTEHPSTATSYNNIGSTYYSMGDYNKALEFYEKALNVKIKLLGTEHPSTATSYNNIGFVYNRMGDYNKALKFFEKALRICEKVLGKAHQKTKLIYRNLAAIYIEIGDEKKAEEYTQKGD